MTRTRGEPQSRLTVMWLSAWPLWAVIIFAGLAVARWLPAGYARAAVAAPILLLVPGSLTLGAAFSRRHRPQGMAFACFAALLGAVWSVFAALALYALGVLITADSTYWSLLIVSAVLAVIAQGRLLLARQGTGRRVARSPQEPDDPDQPGAESDDGRTPAVARRAKYYASLAIVTGVSLLCGGLYAYDHLPHPAPVGYTWMAWTGPRINGDIAVGSGGTTLPFEIVHHESDRTVFQLSAAWLGSQSLPLAKPVTLSIGPDQTFRGALLVPALPNGCTYRVVVALTATRQTDPVTKKPPTWSINADVHDPSKALTTCT